MINSALLVAAKTVIVTICHRFFLSGLLAATVECGSVREVRTSAVALRSCKVLVSRHLKTAYRWSWSWSWDLQSCDHALDQLFVIFHVFRCI